MRERVLKKKNERESTRCGVADANPQYPQTIRQVPGERGVLTRLGLRPRSQGGGNMTEKKDELGTDPLLLAPGRPQLNRINRSAGAFPSLCFFFFLLIVSPTRVRTSAYKRGGYRWSCPTRRDTNEHEVLFPSCRFTVP